MLDLEREKPPPDRTRSWCRKNPRQNRTRYFPEKPAAEPDPIFPVDGAGSGWAFAQIDEPRRPDRLPALGSPRPGRWRAPWASRPRKPPGGSPARSDSAASHADIRLNTPARRHRRANTQHSPWRPRPPHPGSSGASGIALMRRDRTGVPATLGQEQRAEDLAVLDTRTRI